MISLSLKGRVTFLVHRAVWKTKQSHLRRHSVDDSWISEWKEMVTRKRCQDACGCGSGRTGVWWRVGGGSSDEDRAIYSATLGEEPWHAHGLLTKVPAVFFTP